jgi:hypothetical protein
MGVRSSSASARRLGPEVQHGNEDKWFDWGID